MQGDMFVRKVDTPLGLDMSLTDDFNALTTHLPFGEFSRQVETVFGSLKHKTICCVKVLFNSVCSRALIDISGVQNTNGMLNNIVVKTND